MTDLVLVHGSRLNAAAWDPLREYLPQDLRVHAPDLPGHGTRAEEPFTVADGVAAIAEAVSGCTQPPLVVGHSLGGLLAIDWAAQAGADELRGLMLLGATAGQRPALALPYQLLGGGLRRALSTPGLDRLVIAVDAATLRRLLPSGAEVVRRGTGVAAIPDAWSQAAADVDPERLAQVPVPVRAVNGRLDQFRAGESGFRAARPDDEVHHVPGTHLAPMTHPAEVATEIEAFLAELDGAASP